MSKGSRLGFFIVESRDIRKVLRSPDGLLVYDQMRAANDRNFQAFNFRFNASGPCLVEVYGINGSQNIYPAWRYPDL